MIWFGMVTLPLLYPIPIFIIIIYKKWFGVVAVPLPTHPTPIFII